MSVMNRKTIIYLAVWTLILSIFWLLLSGFLKFLLLSFGAVSVVLVLVLIKRMDNLDHQAQLPYLSVKFIRYLTWLVGQMVLSSIQVAKIVWGNSKELSPTTAKLPVKDIPKNARALYANSITLTPGTLSVDIDEHHVTVHALEKESVESLRAGEMAKNVSCAVGGKD